MNAVKEAEPKTEQKPPEPATSKGEVTIFQPPRLPWHQAFEEKFGELGVNKSSWYSLVGAVYPSARTIDAVAMALSYCAARKLDPFKRPIHIVPMWDSKSGGYLETVWPGISELRTTAARTDSYAGCDEAVFGPMIKKKFKGRVKDKGGYVEKEIEVEFHEWCRMTMYRVVKGVRCAFVGPKVLWLESYATIGPTDIPNDMWQTRSTGQLEKCAEAAALRRAFPEELGNQYAAEEMEGRRQFTDIASAGARDITNSVPMTTAAAPPVVEQDDGPPMADIVEPKKPAAPAGAQTTARPPVEPKKAEPEPAGAAKVPRPADDDMPPVQDDGPPALDGEILPPEAKKEVEPLDLSKVKPDPDNPSTNPLGFLAWADQYMGGITTAADLDAAWNANIAEASEAIPPELHVHVWRILATHEKRLEGK